MDKSEFVQTLLASVSGMSRTVRTGSVNALGREGKPKAEKPGRALQESSMRGLVCAANRLWTYRDRSMSARDLRLLELQLFASVTSGIQTPSMYRQHDTGKAYGVPIGEIDENMSRWFQWLASGLAGLTQDQATDLLAELEYELDFRIHPYSDGCGRMTKLWSALVCLKADVPLTTYTDRKAYYLRMNQSAEAFQSYYRALRGDQ